MPSVSLTEDQIMAALGDFITAIMPVGVEVIQGQDNLVPMPGVSDFVVMTPAQRVQMSQTTHSYDPTAQDKEVGRSTGLHFQLDVYGPSASDNTQVLTTLFRDEYGFDFFKPRGIAPLYCDDGQQMPLVSGEKTWIQRWMMRGLLQANLSVTIPQQSALELEATVIQADTLPLS